MKLSTENVPMPDHRWKPDSVLNVGQNMCGIHRLKCKAVHKIKVCIAWNSREQVYVPAQHTNVIPSDVWNTLCAAKAVKALDLSRNQIQSVALAPFSSSAG